MSSYLAHDEAYSIQHILSILRFPPPIKQAASKSLTNCITWCCIENTSPWAGLEFKTLVVIGTDFIGSCKSNYHTIVTTPSSQELPITDYIEPLFDLFLSTFFWTSVLGVLMIRAMLYFTVRNKIKWVILE